MGGRREHRRAAARGSTSRRARGRAGGAGRGRERRTTTTRPRDPTGRGERTRRGAEDRRRRRRRAAGEGATRRKTRRSPPDRRGPPGAPPASPSLPPRSLTRVCGQDAPRPTGGWKPGTQPTGATPKPRGLGGTRHRAAAARGEARGGGRTPRRPAGHHRGTHPRGAATRATRPRGEPPAPTGRGVVWGGRGARKEPQAARRTAAGSRPDTAATAAAAALGARGKREAAAARTRPPDRYRAGSQPRGAGTRPDAPTPPPAKHTMPKRPLAARGGSQRDGGGQGQRPRREPSGPSLPSHGRRAPPPRPRSRRRPPPANPPHRPTRAPSSERAAGAGRGGGWGAGQIRQEAEGARQCLHLGGRRAHGGPARTPQPRHPRRGKHPGGGD